MVVVGAVKRLLLLSVLLFVASALPAHADSFTIDSTNCSAPGDCYDLSWMLTINSGTFGAFSYEAILDVADDPNVSGTPTATISAVDFKVSSSVVNATLYAFPTSSSGWTTGVNVLSSAGCVGPNAGFVCSDSSSDPAEFVGPTLTWGWYFNTDDPIFPSLDGGHIGAKLTTLSTPGQLLSQTHSVPEPSTLLLLGTGLAAVAFRRRRKS